MKKVIAFMLATVMLSSLLGACATRSCEQPPPVNYKDEMKMK
jgi:hypothetical protein